MATRENEQSRRDCLKYLGCATASLALSGMAGKAFAQIPRAVIPSPAPPPPLDDAYDFLFARVKFPVHAMARGADWNVYPGGERNLLEEFHAVVRCKVKIPTNCTGQNPVSGDESIFNAVVTFEDGIESLRRYPFLFMTGEGSFTFNQTQKTQLKKYVEEGGFLLIDDCVLAPAGDLLYQSSYAMLEETFGKGSVVRIPNDNEIFHNVYDLGKIGLPHCQGKNHGARGVFVGERVGVFLSATDLHCGWVDRNKEWFPNPSLGSHGYKEAIQMGINIIMYSLSH